MTRYRPFACETTVHKIGLGLVALFAMRPGFIIGGWIPEAAEALGFWAWFAIAGAGGALGGWLFTSGKGPFYVGLVSGAAATAGSLLVIAAWLRVSTSVLKLELVIAFLLGAAPAGVVHYLWLRRRSPHLKA
jgi:hypothetical protein